MNRLLPAAVFVVILAIGLSMTMVVFQAEQKALQSRFEVVADDAADRVRERVEQYVTSLKSVQSYFKVERGRISRDQFAQFIEGLDLENRFAGMRGLGFARMMEVGEEAAAEAELARNYGKPFAVWPVETDQKMRTPIVLLEPQDQKNESALGYDMYSDPARRAGMMGAMAADAPVASGPVQLVQETGEEKQHGFLIFLPYRMPDSEDVAGFVYAPFRAGDLHTAALTRALALPVVVETRDVTLEEPSDLYRSPDFEEIAAQSEFSVDRAFDVAGRTWRMTIVATPAFADGRPGLGVIALGLISVLLALALSATVRFQMEALESARGLHSNAEKSLKEKDLMLQEMKHRIKNSIARVLAIARQTAAHADTLEDFSESYMSRLQAMAGAQDMLTRSHWQRADLVELLQTELKQVFGEDNASWTVTGDDVELNEKATQSLGLVFHELATNALKYGGVSEPGGSLAVSWSVARRPGSQSLEIVWTEDSGKPVSEPERVGFGTRLIDANVQAELGGSVERRFGPSGLTVRLVLPADSYK